MLEFKYYYNYSIFLLRLTIDLHDFEFFDPPGRTFFMVFFFFVSELKTPLIHNGVLRQQRQAVEGRHGFPQITH